MNAALIVPVHKMTEKDFKKMGIDYWSSDFSDVFRTERDRASLFVAFTSVATSQESEKQ